MAELAANAGLSPATPYNLFGTKANLLALLFAAEIAGFHQALTRAGWADPIETIFGSAALLSAELIRRPLFYRNLTSSMRALSLAEVRPLILQLNEEMLLPVVEQLAVQGAFESWISVHFITGHVTRLYEAASVHWASGEWSSERFVVELRFGLGMALLGCLRAPLRARLRRELRAITPALAKVQAMEVASSAAAQKSESCGAPVAEAPEIL